MRKKNHHLAFSKTCATTKELRFPLVSLEIDDFISLQFQFVKTKYSHKEHMILHIRKRFYYVFRPLLKLSFLFNACSLFMLKVFDSFFVVLNRFLLLNCVCSP